MTVEESQESETSKGTQRHFSENICSKQFL